MTNPFRRPGALRRSPKGVRTPPRANVVVHVRRTCLHRTLVGFRTVWRRIGQEWTPPPG